MENPPGRDAVHRRARPGASGRIRREPGQCLVSARGRAHLPVARRAGTDAGRPVRPARELRADLVARPTQRQRGARPGTRDQLWARRGAVRDPLGAAGPARPSSGDRDRSPRRAVGDRARHGGGDARFERPGGGSTALALDRSTSRGGGLARPSRNHPGARGPVRGGAGRDDRRDRRDDRHVSPDDEPADALERAGARHGAARTAARRMAGEHRDPRTRGGVAGVARRRARSRGVAAGRRAQAWLCGGRRTLPLWFESRGAGGPRRAAGRSTPRAVGRRRDHARSVDGVHPADARARLGARVAGDRSGRARQAIPADRKPAGIGRHQGPRDPRRSSRHAALRTRRRSTRSRSTSRST